MGVNGNKKGGGYERIINKKLSLWLSNGNRQDLFTRSSMSGGRATIAKKKGELLFNDAGDSTAIDPLSFAFTQVFFIEYKFYKDLGLLLFFFKGAGKLGSFWKTACREALDYGKEPLLICKQNFSKDLVVIERHSMDYFKKVKGYRGIICKRGNNNTRVYELDHFINSYQFKGEQNETK